MTFYSETLSAEVKKKVIALRDEAKKALAEHDFQYAKDVLDNAIELDSSSYKLYRLRSIAHAALGQFARSAEDADRVISLAPSIMDGYYHKGFALFQIRRYSEAAHAFQDGLKLNPTDRALQQGFWDAITLVGQSRTNPQALAEALGTNVGSADNEDSAGLAGSDARDPANMTPLMSPTKAPKGGGMFGAKSAWAKMKDKL